MDSTKKFDNVDFDTTTTQSSVHYFPRLPGEKMAGPGTGFGKGNDPQALVPPPGDDSYSREGNVVSDEEYTTNKRTARDGKPVSARALLARSRFPPLPGSHTTRTSMLHLPTSTPHRSHAVPGLSGSASRLLSRVGSNERSVTRYAGRREAGVGGSTVLQQGIQLGRVRSGGRGGWRQDDQSIAATQKDDVWVERYLAL